MAMVIQHNIPALQTYNIVNGTSNSLQKSIAKLSSGLRINSAADDAAGLAISEKMRSQIGGLDKAVANTQDGISLIQTAEGALQETHSILQRMRELSVQAANDTLTQQDRSYIQVELDQLKDEVTRIGNTTQFNKKKLLNGEAAALWSSDDNNTKAIINGGLRTIDQFGQKSSVEGNYKIKIKADPGQGEVQKSDIMKIKHDDVVMNKSTYSKIGVTDVAVKNEVAGHFDVTLTDTKGSTTAGKLTGAYGLGGSSDETETEMTFVTLSSPVTKVSVQTTDGVEIWSTTGSDIFQSNGASTDSDTQVAFFNGGTGSNDQVFTGVFKEIQQAAKDRGITLTGDIESMTATTLNSGTAPGIKIVYEGGGAGTTPTSKFSYNGATGVDPAGVFTINVGTKLTENASILFEVTARDTVNNTVTLKATASKLSYDGVNSTAVQDNILLKAGDTNFNLDKLFGGDSNTPSVQIQLNAGQLANISDDAKFVYEVTPQTKPASVTNEKFVQIQTTMDSSWEDAWAGGPYRGQTLEYAIDADKNYSKEIHFKNFNLNEKTGVATEGDVIITTDSTFRHTVTGGGTAMLADTNAYKTPQIIASFDTGYIGKVASGDTKLRDLDKFWNSEGVFMLEDAKTITLNQGDGKTANVTLYANDTLDDVAKKINDAIATDLGQAKYVDDATNFASFVSGATRNSESVEGTMLIRSVIPGKSGEITLSGDENILNALSLNTIQNSKETSYSVDISNAHTGEILKQNVKVTGNIVHHAIGDNVDVEFDALSGISASWDNGMNKFVYAASTQETTLHLADNTTVLQIGANEGEDLGMNIGDMRSHALGLDGVNVMSHDRAARSITIIDNAIDKVSTQRANLGAYQNRLEYTASNLTTASENLTSAESRIRDTDMAKEMMNFTKLNIMLQAGNSMLAQANQQPQNVLSLIR